MDGYEVARQLRSQTATRNCRLAALTGYGQPEDVERATRAGFDAHFVKPVDIGTISLYVQEPAHEKAMTPVDQP